MCAWGCDYSDGSGQHVSECVSGNCFLFKAKFNQFLEKCKYKF